MKAWVLSSGTSGASPSLWRDMLSSSKRLPLRMRSNTSEMRGRSASGTLDSMKSEIESSPPLSIWMGCHRRRQKEPALAQRWSEAAAPSRACLRVSPMQRSGQPLGLSGSARAVRDAGASSQRCCRHRPRGRAGSACCRSGCLGSDQVHALPIELDRQHVVVVLASLS